MFDCKTEMHMYETSDNITKKKILIGPTHIRKLRILIRQFKEVRTCRIYFHLLKLKSQKAMSPPPKQPLGRLLQDIFAGN